LAELVDLIRERVSSVKEAMVTAATKAGRPADSMRLLVVTKRHSIETIQAAIEAGLSRFGENYPEEAAAKLTKFKEHPSIRWEMIGHIQCRKANLVALGFDLIHSVDSLKLASKIYRLREPSELAQNILIEVNIAAETNKDGFRVDSESEKSNFYRELEGIAELGNLKIIGLMGMPPLQQNPETNRFYFAALRELRESLNERYDWKLNELSMGTSADFQVAIEEGATVIRIGEAILGKRN
jgi:pyridoxal phosphate enzyme (YggS family)